MKRLIRTGLLIGVFMLIIPIHRLDANFQQHTHTLFTTGSFQNITPAVTNSAKSLVPVEVQGNANPNQGAGNVENNVNRLKSEKPASDGVLKPVVKPVEASETSVPLKPTKKTALPAVSADNQQDNPKQLTPEPVKNKMRLESILLHLGSWWLANPYNLQLWYIFCFITLILYLCKLKEYRRPLLFLSIMILGFYLESSLDPIGAIFNLVPKTRFTFDTAFFILGFAVIISLFLGRFYCGWFCPLGAVQELIHPGTPTRIPAALDLVLKYLKYLILLTFIYITWRSGDNLWTRYEPLKVLVNFKGSELAAFLLIVTLGLSIIVERPFCRYICPLGAILALTSRLALFKMKADSSACMVCGRCTVGDCPMNAIESTNSITDLPRINNSECIYCMRCQKICQRSALHVSVHRNSKAANQ